MRDGSLAYGGEAQARVREGGALRGVGVPGGAHELVGAGRAALGRLHAVAALHVPHHLRQRLPIIIALLLVSIHILLLMLKKNMYMYSQF